jgi:hypothetical protein
MRSVEFICVEGMALPPLIRSFPKAKKFHHDRSLQIFAITGELVAIQKVGQVMSTGLNGCERFLNY